jgi:hypothetical protein
MIWNPGKTLRKLAYLPLVAGACTVALVGAGAATTAPAALQVNTLTANAPNQQGSVIQGQAIFDPNTLTLMYCLTSPFGAESQCASSNLSTILTSGDSGPAGGRTYIVRVDAGDTGSVPSGTGGLTPTLHPVVYVTRVAVTSTDQAFDGYFAFELTIGTDSNGLFMPIIGGPI